MADPDPWHGLVSFLEDVLGTCNRAVGTLFAIRPDWRQRFQALIRDLLLRAQNAGAARSDLTTEDVTLVLLGVARTMAITGQATPELWRRHLAIVLDGMRADHEQRLPGLPVTPEQLDQDLRTWSCHALRNGAAWP
jgi:hypothetical protein